MKIEVVEYGPEAVIEHTNGFTLRTSPYPAQVDYVRVCDPAGKEIAYWVMDELREDPADVMGAIFGALIQVPADEEATE